MPNRAKRLWVLAWFLALIPIQVPGQAQTPSATVTSPSPNASGLPEDPKVTDLVRRWIAHLQSESPTDLRSLTLQDGPVLVVAAGVLAGQGEPISITYAGATPPNDYVPSYIYSYKVKFQNSNVGVMLFIDSSGNVHQVMFTSDHPLPL